MHLHSSPAGRTFSIGTASTALSFNVVCRSLKESPLDRKFSLLYRDDEAVVVRRLP